MLKYPAVNPLTPIVGLNVRVPGCKNYKRRLNQVWHRMLYSCTHMAKVGVKGLKVSLKRTLGDWRRQSRGITIDRRRHDDGFCWCSKQRRVL